MGEADTSALSAIVTDTLLGGIGHLTLEGEVKPLGGLVVEVQQTRVAGEASVGRDTLDVVVAEGGEVAEPFGATICREGDVAESTRAEEFLPPVRAGLSAPDEAIVVRCYVAVGDGSFGLLT